jgi:hypothetical protein
MKTVIAVGVLILLAVFYDLHLKQNRLTELQRRLDAVPKGAPLEYQEKCSEQAQRLWKESGLAKNEANSYENHYSVALNKCFIVYHAFMPSGGALIWQDLLYDAYEQRQLAHHAQNLNQTAPLACSVTLPSGEEKTCTSDDDFASLIRAYMEN